jgi:NAD(P)-dependent dehydrogenase (short-subunit alcohol dehydrogenase family)
MEQTLKGKTAVVTGGTRGIGRAIAESLAREGASVAICGRRQADVDAAVSQIASSTGSDVIGATANVGEPEQVSRFFSYIDGRFDKVDILVNNAGIGIFRSVAELSVEDWQQVVATNLNGVFYCCREAVPRMRKAGGGSIINISSLAGKNAFAGGSVYNASKFGLNGFSEALMLDHRNDKIRVTYIMPGSVDTDFNIGTGRASWKIAPEDIADVVLLVVRMPARTMVSRIEMRPSIPPK